MSVLPLLSRSERQYILDGVRENIRADGRECDSVGYISLKTGVVSNTNGSAKIDRERTSVIIGVKAELGEPHPSAPHEGYLDFHVDCSALAGPIYERRGGDLLSDQLSWRLEEAYSSPTTVDRADLCVSPGRQCWILHVDALVLEVGGALLDTLSLGVRAALQDTTLPDLTVTGEGDDVEIEVSDNPHDSHPIKAAGAPVITTLYQVGGRSVVDCTLEEEMCSSCQLSVAVSKEGVLYTSLEGGGGIPYSQMNDVITMGLKISEGILADLDSSNGRGQADSELFS